MPVDYHIDKDRRLIITRAHGVVRDAEMLAHQRALAADPDFDPGFDQLVMPDGLTEFAVGTETYKKLAAETPFREGSRRAIVAPTQAGFGLSRMFEALAARSGSRIRVFRDREAALDWLASEVRD